MGLDISRNAMLGFPNSADLAVLSGGSWAATLPLSRVQNRVVSEVARSTNAANASTQFKITFPAEQTFRLLSLINHNGSLYSQYRITQYSDAGFTNLIDDTGVIDIWQAIFPTLAMSWRSKHWWSGKPDLDDIASYRWSLLHIYDSDKSARYIKFEIFDDSNPDGYFQFGRLFVSKIFQPLFNFNWQASIHYESFTSVQINKRSGQEFYDVAQGRRIARIQFDDLQEYEAMQLLDMQRVLDVHGEVFFIWDSTDLINRVRRCFLGRQYELNAIEHPYVNNHSNALEIREIL